MSNQNRKRRIRARMQATDQKYTSAARDQETRESLRSPNNAPGPISLLGRRVCDDCGGPVRWVSPDEIRKVNPSAYAEAKEVIGASGLMHGSAWVCTTCDSIGFTSEPEEDLDVVAQMLGIGLPSGSDPEHCKECGTQVDWIDPASVASIDRPAFVGARKQYGIDSLLDGHASRCPACGQVRFFPH